MAFSSLEVPFAAVVRGEWVDALRSVRRLDSTGVGSGFLLIFMLLYLIFTIDYNI